MFNSILIGALVALGGYYIPTLHLADSLSPIRPEIRRVAIAPKLNIEPIKASVEINFEEFSLSGDVAIGVAHKLVATSIDSTAHFSIAFLGDSFIEADILTNDIRAELQRRFGGAGIGFVPFASVSSRYTQSIIHRHTGWKSFNYNNPRTSDRSKQTIIGQYCIPQEEAYASYRGVARHNGLLARFATARLLFVNNGKSTIRVTIDGKMQSFNPPSSPSLQYIDIAGDFASIEVRLSNVAGFVGYGVVLGEKGGVRVDNYSVRAASGMMLASINPILTKQFAAVMPYDMIVLQYGLNSAGPSTTNFTSYKSRMVAAIKLLREAYPHAVIVVMGIGDRWVQNGGNYVPMASIPYMIEAQRDIARQTGSLFWDTQSAMGGKGSMLQFVNSKPPLAARDYTHINFGGGRRVALCFTHSIVKNIK